MGLINNDTMITKSGLVVPVGAYMSIGTDTLDTVKEEGKYTLTFTNTVWKDQAARDAQVRPFQTNPYTIPLTTEQLNTSVYTVSYDYLRTLYPNTTDV